MKLEQVRKSAGFTLVELLMVVAAVVALVAVAMVAIGQTRERVGDVKLRSDIETLNAAVQVYLGNGGSMDGVGSVGAALAKLKTEADAASAKSVVGLRGAMLDPRYQAEMMTVAESAGAGARALWNAGKQRFVYATEGADGAKRFYLDEAGADQDPLEEARATALSYGSRTGWVWDYADRGIAADTGVGEFGVGAPSTGGYTRLTPPAAQRLQPPSISLEGGRYDYFDFDLGVALLNPNPAGTSVLYYTLDDSRWQVYGGGDILVGRNQELKAYAVSIDPDEFADSDFAAERYESSFMISGNAGGDFHTPEGPHGMVSNLGAGERGSYFSFGTAAGTPDPSWLLFNGASFAGVGAGESFLLGTIDYYNGTIRSGTQAAGVGLSISLSFAGSDEGLSFDYDFELISTPNLGGNTAEENADYVRLGDLYAAVPVDLGGVSYSLILEFGETSAGGFSTIDEFHVLEGQAASGDLYGRLVELERAR